MLLNESVPSTETPERESVYKMFVDHEGKKTIEGKVPETRGAKRQSFTIRVSKAKNKCGMMLRDLVF